MDTGTVLAAVLGAVAGAVGFRVRGGWFGDLWGWSGQTSRAFYAIVMASITVLAGGAPGWTWGLLAAGWFIGAIAIGTLGAVDAGRNEGSKIRDFFLNCARGALYAAPAALALIGLRAWTGDDAETAPFLVLFGLAQGPAYELSWRFWPVERGGKPTVLAEFISGAFLGAGAALV